MTTREGATAQLTSEEADQLARRKKLKEGFPQG